MDDPLDQEHALAQMDAVAGLFEFVSANLNDLLRKSNDGVARFGWIAPQDNTKTINAIVDVINSRMNQNCHGLPVNRELIVGVVKRILIKRGHLVEAPESTLPNASTHRKRETVQQVSFAQTRTY